MINHVFISFSAVQIYDLSNIHLHKTLVDFLKHAAVLQTVSSQHINHFSDITGTVDINEITVLQFPTFKTVQPPRCKEFSDKSSGHIMYFSFQLVNPVFIHFSFLNKIFY